MDGVKQQDSTPQNDSTLGFKWIKKIAQNIVCIVPAEITEPPKISGGQNHKSDGRLACGIFFIKN
jgi:hypothetical protein